MLTECEEILGKCEPLISRRGPNSSSRFHRKIGNLSVIGLSSVLWLQGDCLCDQPIIDDEGNILMWNGDIFELAELTLKESDTSLLAKKLSSCISDQEILSTMAGIRGPWAMVFFHATTKTLWFGRDFFGRQSLLISQTGEKLILSSCVSSDLKQFEELPALGLFKGNLSCDSRTVPQITLHPWGPLKQIINQKMYKFVISNQDIQCPVIIDCPTENLQYSSEHIKENILFESLLLNPDVIDLVSRMESVLRRSVSTRMSHQPDLCKDCVLSSQECVHAAVGVLFSGGLDSCVIAALAASMTDKPIHLYNVAFQQQDGSYDVPDRATGVQAFAEIRSLFPHKKISLILVNVTLEELQESRSSRVKDLLHPLDSVLDDSIGCAIWFAARGAGYDSLTGKPIQSKARVLLLGMGIDEQLGGYSRHRTVFSKEGCRGLAEELKKELVNISRRNLGRDNRIVSDHGVAPRFPFLDENFISFLATVPLNLKCNFNFDRGYGEKLILRLLALKMGLVLTSKEPKRAVQFGSRIAKIENRKEKGHQKAIRS